MAITVPPTADESLAYDDRARAENFPVALRILPPGERDALRRVYATVRYIDDLGDEAHGDRASLLHSFDDELVGLAGGLAPRTECLRRLAPVLRDRDLPVAALRDLVRANLMDQQVHRYATFGELLGYCALSANPIGRIVLAIFGRTGPELERRSDQICSALQVLEHCQDVAEDLDNGRIYLPRADLRDAGITGDDVCAIRHREALRTVVLLQVTRAQAMLDDGRPLIADLHGWARIAVAGYLAGGLATAAALRRARGEVVAAAPRPGRLRTLATLLRLLAAGALR